MEDVGVSKQHLIQIRPMTERITAATQTVPPLHRVSVIICARFTAARLFRPVCGLKTKLSNEKATDDGLKYNIPHFGFRFVASTGAYIIVSQPHSSCT
ncbi:Hypothetical protein SMAX5B_009301 [Scophthalmus maximus]|uniref:Uncharacterized protein n=1 Tax=Scophthalmus maximus TaxID=52904 RepID=A0A2U9C5L0_SCOMX|nr:Hypothetical protein SMAX5B_009301 [Scophthalmus maximus]